MDIKQWKKRIETERNQKDLFFASNHQSPLPLIDRAVFHTLAYWPPNPEYRFELQLYDHADKENVLVGDTSGRERRYLKWGEFQFQVAASICTLQAYKSDAGDERLFMPFRDETSGRESYAPGRYIDLRSAIHLTPEGLWIVDFNKAYNPWCAYSDDYVCPIVPAENCLRVPILAGEKQYPYK